MPNKVLRDLIKAVLARDQLILLPKLALELLLLLLIERSLVQQLLQLVLQLGRVEP
jgi:hypothetical protein